MAPAREGSVRRVHPLTAAVLFGVVILVTHGFGNSLVPALLPRIAESFQTGYGVLGLAVGAGLLAYGLGAALAMRILDLVPPRGLLVLCLAVCGIGFLAVSAATSPGMLALCVLVIGLASPISWAVTLQIAARTVNPGSHGRVMAVAAAGAGAGNGLNGVFVQMLTGPGQWRSAFIVAAGVTACAIAGTWLVFRRPVGSLSEETTIPPAGNAWRRIWAVRGGRIVILMSMLAGAGSFVFAAYLSEVAVDELHVSPLAAAVPWWLASVVGVVAALLAGLMSDRGSPIGVMRVMALVYAASLAILAVVWSYPGLLAAAFGFAVFNFPIWGLFGLAAHRSLPPDLAVRAVSGGLAMAAWAATACITLAGLWIDRAGSFRGPVAMLVVLMVGAAVWLGTEHRAESRGRLHYEGKALSDE